MAEDPQSYTVDQLAGDIKAKLPRYKDVDNQKLVNDWVKKYPKYGDHLQVQAPKPEVKAPTQQPTAPQTSGQKLSIGSDALMSSIARWRPRWDDPSKVLTDPHWYQASARYAAGGALGVAKAGANVAVGGAKLIHDVASASDPIENYSRAPYFGEGGAGTQVGHDVVDLGKGILDTGKALWDMIRHFPEAESDPDKFGQTLANVAMTVDGGIKGAGEVAKVLKSSPVVAMQSALKSGSKSVYDGLFKQRAIEDAYVHTKGVDVATKFVKSVGEAQKEVEVHVNALSKIDTNIPSGVIDASKEADVITKNFADIVKTPEKYHPVLKNMLDYAKKTAPGQWMFDSTRQLRSAVGRAMHAVDGPQFAVLSSVYADLTTKLSGVAKKYGLGESWDHYNELERKINKSFPIIDKMKDVISGNEGGTASASALKNWKEVEETVKSLSKYGLDPKEVALYAQRANAILKERGNTFRSLFRYAYGNPYGIPALIAAREMGAGWLGGAAAGAMTGLAMTHLVHAVRAMKLAPEITEHILFSREWPGKLKPSAGTFPKEPPKALPEGPSVPPEQPKASPKEAPRTTSKESFQKEMMSTLKIPYQPPGTTSPMTPPVETKPGIVTPVPKVEPKVASSEAVGREPGGLVRDSAAYYRIQSDSERASRFDKMSGSEKQAELQKAKQEIRIEKGTTRESKIGRATKARERVAKVRAEKGATALGGGGLEVSGGDALLEATEAKEAQRRASSPHVSVEHLQIPEMEEALRNMKSDEFESLQKLRRKKAIPDSDYIEGLKYLLLEEYEKRSSQGTP